MNFHIVVRAAMRIGAIILTTSTGCVSGPPENENSTLAIRPVFPSPCMPGADCGLMKSCADTDYVDCEGFAGAPGIRREVTGRFGQLDFRVQPVRVPDGEPASLWHDVPLVVSDDKNGLIVNAYFEISRGSQAKIELNKWVLNNPIWQDRKEVSGQSFQRPRYYGWSPAPGNYGALPRTWENVLEPDPRTGYLGDTDPIDVLDFGERAAPTGLLTRVKVIGALGMIDGTDMQTDWKICVINTEDPRAGEINDITDVDQDTLDQWAIFWRFYKSAAGLRQNFFYAPSTPGGFSADAEWLGAEDAARIVKISADSYRKLVDECLNWQVDPPYWLPGCPTEGVQTAIAQMGEVNDRRP